MHHGFGKAGGIVQDNVGVSECAGGHPAIAIYGVLLARATAAKMLRRRYATNVAARPATRPGLNTDNNSTAARQPSIR